MHIATVAVIFGLTCIFLFAFIHWVVIDQALSENPRQKVVFQGGVVAGMT